MQSYHPARRTITVCRAAAFLGIALAAGAAAAQTSADPSRGKAKAAACEACHGAPGRPALAGMPPLAGQQEEFLALQMFLFREGLREAPQMSGMLNGFSDWDLVDVAAYFTRQTAPRNRGEADAQLHARGAALAKAMGCGSCHLQDYSGQKQVPRLTGLPEDYLAATMKAYRDNKRKGADTSMNGLLYKVPDGDIQALAHYLAHQ
jgi:cytochrome c553